MSVFFLRLASVALAFALSGCASLSRAEPPDTIASHGLEVAFQLANAVDFAQTVNIARRPDCYREEDPFTDRVIGQHPSTAAVGAMWAAQAAAHYLVTTWLDREVDATDATGWRVARLIWQGVTLGNSLRNVIRNDQIGLRPFGAGAECDGAIKLARRK